MTVLRGRKDVHGAHELLGAPGGGNDGWTWSPVGTGNWTAGSGSVVLLISGAVT